MRMRWLAVVAGIFVMGATPDRSPRVETYAVSATEYAIVVYLHQVPDGMGAADSIYTKFVCASCPGDERGHVGSITKDSVVRLKPAPGTTETGTAYTLGVRNRSTRLIGPLSSKAWSYTNTDVAPVIVADSAVAR